MARSIRKVVASADSIGALHATPEGLWIGHQGGVTFFDPESADSLTWTTADGLPAHPVGDIDSASKRLVVATPNGVAWLEDRVAAIRQGLEGSGTARWKHALAHPRGEGVHVNGVTLVGDSIHATTGGGRIYFETANGFQLIELPLPQARLLRVLPLPCAPGQRRLLIVTNNSGVLLLATGDAEEPSLYQWGEDEGLMSRYVTAALATEGLVLLGVHGGIHFARTQDLVQRPASLSSWDRIPLPGAPGPSEQKRVHDLVQLEDSLYAATSAGLYRLAPAGGEGGTDDALFSARRVEDIAPRHLAVWRDELWVVRNNELGHFLDGTPAMASATSAAPQPSRRGTTPDPERPRIMSFGRRWRFLNEPRWRHADSTPGCQAVVSLCSTDLGLAVGGEGGRLCLLQDGRWSTEVIVRMRRPPEVQSVVLDPDSGNLWATMRHGLFQRTSPGRWHRDVAFPGRNVQFLQVWNDNVLALGNNGLYEYSQGAWSPVLVDGDSPSLSVAASAGDTLAMVDRSGTALYLWEGSEARPRRVAAAIGRANCMAWDAQRLWIGTDQGLLRWEAGRLERLSWSRHGDNRIAALLVWQGTLYVGSASGLWCVAASALQEQSSATLERFGERLGLLEGLPHLQVTGLAVHEEDVWVGTQAGLAVLG